MLAKHLGYEYGFERPEGADPFFGNYAIDPSTRIIWAGHGWLVKDSLLNIESVDYGMEQKLSPGVRWEVKGPSAHVRLSC